MYPRINRQRMLSIRLSDTEFQHFQKLCAERGAHSLSELAREALRRLASLPPDPTPGVHITERLSQLDDRVSLLLTEVRRLGALAKPVNGGKSDE